MRGPESFGTVIGLLLVAFLTLVGAATVFGSIPGLGGAGVDAATALTAQHLSFLVGANAYYFGVAVAWLTLRPFLLGIELTWLADIFSWLLLGVIVAGASRLSLFLYRMNATRAMSAIAVVPVAAVLTMGYWLLALPLPLLLPDNEPAFTYAAVGFALSAPSFLAQTGLLWMHADSRAIPFLSGLGDRLMLVYVQWMTVVVGLLWFAVVFR